MAFFTQSLLTLQAFLLSKNILFLGAGVIGIGLIIAFHELGHFIFCKLFKVKVPSFSIGFGPKIFRKRFAGTEFSLSAIPLGGYVEMAQISEDSPSPEQKKHYFEAQAYWRKMLIISGGILFNLIFTYFVLVFLYASGMPNTNLVYPENAQPVVESLVQDGPAQKAGLRVGDRIMAIDGTPIQNDIPTLFDLLQPLADQKTELTIERDARTQTLSVLVGEHPATKKGFLGIGFQTTALEPLSLPAAASRGCARVIALFSQTLGVFKHMFAARSIEGLGGPIMIFSQTVKHAERGLKIFLAFLALISINLAVLNLIPLPILDGGQALFATIEAILRRPLSLRIREYIALSTWVLLIVLTLYISFKDIVFIRALRAAEQVTVTSNK